MTDSRRSHTTASVRRRRPHRAAGSRVLTAVLSVGAAAGLMASMGIADARTTTTPDVVAIAAQPAPVVSVTTRPTILLPVPASASAPAPTTTVTTITQAAATPQPVKLVPQRRVVTVKSNGSK